MAFRKLGRCREAIKDCNRAIQIDPQNGHFYYNRALAQYDLGFYEEVPRLSVLPSLIALAAAACFGDGSGNVVSDNSH